MYTGFKGRRDDNVARLWFLVTKVGTLLNEPRWSFVVYNWTYYKSNYLLSEVPEGRLFVKSKSLMSTPYRLHGSYVHICSPSLLFLGYALLLLLL